jgi:nitroreductase
MTNSTDFYDILSTTRSIRRISDKPIDDEVLNRVLQAAIWAPSGGNRQPWRIIAVRDRAIKQQLSDIYAQRWSEYVDMNMKRVEGMPENIVEATRKGLAIGTQLATSLADVPVVAMFVHDPREVFVTDGNLGRTPVVGGASLYPAVQNFLLAARAEGLGGVLTTLISASENEVRPILQLPEPWGVYAMVPLGYPKGNHGPLRRASLEHMVKFDVWSD